MDPVFHAFAEELEKRAISVGLLQRTLAGRAAQGVGGAAALGKQVAHAAAGGATTARQAIASGGGLAAHRLGAVQQGGLAARRAEGAFAGSKANLQQRFTAAERPGMHSSTPLRTHEGYMGAEHTYSPQYLRQVSGGGGAIHDPKGVMAARPAPVSATGATQIAPTQIADRTQVGQIGGRRLSAPGNPFGSEAASGLVQPAKVTPIHASPAAGTAVGKLRRRAMPAVATA